MFRVGLTGGIGSGKSLVCSILEKLGVAVYYADKEARRLMNDDSDLIKEIRDLLGKESYKEGKLDRVFVAEKVFNDSKLLGMLNNIVHPVVRKDYTSWVEIQKDTPYVVQEAAILFESGAFNFLDWTVVVYAPEELRIRRVMQRDGLDEAGVRQRMALQMDEEKKKELADEVILNDETMMLLPQIIRMHNNILNRK